MDTVKLFNRSNSLVVYSIPDNNIRREFGPGETKEISKDELVQLTYKPGGRELLADYLQVMDHAAAEEISLNTEPEYWMDKNNIKDLILTGSLDQFLDCLDFAPQGVIDLIKDLAISLPMNDSSKREALKKKTGYDVDKVLMNKKAEAEAMGGEIEITPRRRVQAAEATDTTPARRQAPRQYNVVSKN